MNKEQKAQSIIGPLGAIISHSKSGYRERHPENLSIFNANICTKDEKIWWGDLDVTLKQTFIADLAFILSEDLYVLYEMDGRFENEGEPKVDRYAVKFFYDGGVELSESLAENYNNNISRKR
jgi:hypothetical protein